MFKVANKSPYEFPTRKGNSTVKGDDDFVSWLTPSPLTTQGKIAKHAALKYGAEGIRAPYIHHPVFRLQLFLLHQIRDTDKHIYFHSNIHIPVLYHNYNKSLNFHVT